MDRDPRQVGAQRAAPSTLALWIVLAAAIPGVFAAGPLSTPEQPPLHFSIAAWGVAEGLPGAHVNGTAQDVDGTLWIATLTGVVHFDGFTFEVFDAANTSTLPSSRFTAVHRGASGRIWLGSEQGHLVEIRDRSFRSFGPPPYPGSRIPGIVEDRDGRVWLARDGNPMIEGQALVWELVDDRLVPRDDLDPWWVAPAGDGGFVTIGATGEHGAEPRRETVLALSLDEEGRAWGRLPFGRLVRLDDGVVVADESLQFATEMDRTLPGRIVDGRLELSTVAGEPVASVPVREWMTPWLVDSRGLLWVSQDRRWIEAYRGTDPTPVARLEVGSLRDVLEDREGNLWLSSMTGGLLRVSEDPVESFGPDVGMPIPAAVGLTATGEVFVEAGPIARFAPLHVVVDGRAEPIPGRVGWMLRERSGVEWHLEQDVLVGELPGGELRLPAPKASWMVEDPVRDGILWLVDRDQLRRLDTTLASGPAITGSWPVAANRAIASDGAGGLWIGAADGLWHLVGDHASRLGRDHGLPVENVRALLPDDRGGLWLGTYGGGLVHLDGTRLLTLGSDRGLPEAVVSSLIRDRSGDLWFAGNRGIHRVRQVDLERALVDPGATLQVLSFRAADGLANPETTGRPAVMTADGRLWFGTFGGLVAVDPAVIARREARPPQVLIQSVVTASGPRPAGAVAEVAPDASRRLELSFTAIHLADPGSLRFRHRLDPLDPDWTEGKDRSAHYRSLPPGRYRFRVQARHSGGSWTEAPLAQEVVVRPRFRETRGFLWLLAVVGSALVGGAWQLANRQLRQRARQLEQNVAARTAELAAERDLVARQATRLGELAEARAQFMAAVSHELRTPLTLILGPLHDLWGGRLGELPAPALREIATIINSAGRLHRLVDRLLGVARSEAELSRLHCREAELVGFVRRLVDELAPLALRHGSTLSWEPAAESLAVWFDALQLETVVVNLVANAIRHTPAGSTVTVSVARDEAARAATLVVADDGPGIPDDEAPRLFERFFRGRAAGGDGADSFGLGLALVREAVERHRGSIEVATGDGGTTFTVRLPLGRDHLGEEDLAAFDTDGRPLTGAAALVADTPAVGPVVAQLDSSAEPADDGAESDRTTVLVVDDNAELRRLVRRHLEPTYRVREAADGDEALVRIEEGLPDLVLADVMMPGLDGFGLCRAIRSNPEIDFLPVILLTAKASASARMEGLDQGADAHLGKPFHAGVLLATVANLIASRRRLRERYAAAARDGQTWPGTTPATLPAGIIGADDRRYLERLDQVIAAHLHDEELSVDELAQLVHQSRASLYRHVKRLFDRSPSDLLREARLKRAATLIEQREGTVAEVAYAVGFKSTEHFSTCFLNHFGHRPSRWPPPADHPPSTTDRRPP